jgi:hypothetical protein
MKVKINRWVDLVDRTAWAFVLSYASSLIALGMEQLAHHVAVDRRHDGFGCVGEGWWGAAGR